MAFADLRGIELLNRRHERQSFRCGVENLDNYLKDRAISDTEKNLSPLGILAVAEDWQRDLCCLRIGEHLLLLRQARPHKVSR